jgi:hypothetical protein
MSQTLNVRINYYLEASVPVLFWYLVNGARRGGHNPGFSHVWIPQKAANDESASDKIDVPDIFDPRVVYTAERSKEPLIDVEALVQGAPDA